MTRSTTSDAPDRAPLRPGLDRAVALGLAAVEYDRVVDLLGRLQPEDWARQTECPGWDVRAMAGHMLGMAQMMTSVAELARQQARSWRAARASGQLPIDELTALQVRTNAGLGTQEVIERFAAAGPRAVRLRQRMPGLLRGRVIPERQAVGGEFESWTFGYLFDVILTRDPFLHRIDIGRATDTWIPPTADHEGVIVADVVAEWAARHGRPFRLELTGPAGGAWAEGEGGEEHSLDALEFCRLLSGRGTARGLLAVEVPF